MTFKDLNLCSAIIEALTEKGYQSPTAIQQQAIPHILSGKDIVASAATGTGKTASFCIPILQLLSTRTQRPAVRALILSPTRELALQVFDNLKFYGKNLPLKSAVIYGGVSQGNQVKEISRGVDILVATPGRLHDLIDQGVLTLKQVEILVLDEADRMLDMGFINSIRKLIKVIPPSRQNVFFSATMPVAVMGLIRGIAASPVQVSIEASPKTSIEQSVYYVAREDKRSLLKHVIQEQKMTNVIVFARTKYGADKIAKDLANSGIPAEAFHGDKSQNARQRALTNFRKNSTRVLVATDVAARGIDIADLPFVINYELPESAETYTHRIGRTGRAGKSGSALSFCDLDERRYLNNINRISKKNLAVVQHPFN
ncbi:DEAD/DEAH box helicase [Dawidia soli]|uniref:DEAD/DEAH box helicase n=1 Tax=Dawidia soli TaxID=2782352 RepID=A0AAP2DDB1_9BACT|nr:DEAD/DEAH box helicase [Dawidia soli]MBT1689653.1 DEAD/DEAH box helicase [Dawidia soli]